MKALDHSDIKIRNKKRIMDVMMTDRELTKLDIARKLNISVPTVTTITNELIQDGVLQESGMASSTGGRKPVILQFLPNSRFSIGVDFEGDCLRAVLTNLDSDIIEDRQVKLGEAKGQEVLVLVEKQVEEIIKAHAEKRDLILGIGLSLPGIVDEKKLSLEEAPNYNTGQLSFAALKTSFELPIFVENEANAGAISESRLGVASGFENMIYISITEGIGAGIVISKKMMKGKERKAGEIGHMCIERNGRRCGCGRLGCLEAYASNKALIKDYQKKANKKVSSIHEIFALYESNDAYAMQTIEEYIANLSEGIHSLISVLDPDHVVIGGEISQYAELLQSKLIQKVFPQNDKAEESSDKLLFSSLSNNSSILGAAMLPILKYISFE